MIIRVVMGLFYFLNGGGAVFNAMETNTFNPYLSLDAQAA